MAQRHQSGLQNDQGFTIVEGMLASVILAVGLLALSGMQSIALVKNVDANEVTKVTSLAADMMERIQFNRRNAVSYQGIDTTSAATCAAAHTIEFIACAPLPTLRVHDRAADDFRDMRDDGVANGAQAVHPIG